MLSNFLLSKSGKHESTALKWCLIYTVYRYIQLVRLLEHQDLFKGGELECRWYGMVWNADLTVQLVCLLERQDCDKEGELECRSYCTTGSSAQTSGFR